jgi:hypothetical protein
MRPGGLVLGLDQVAHQFAGGLGQIPIGYRGPEATAPAPQVCAECRELAKLRAGAGNPRQRIERGGIRFGICILRASGQSEHEQSRISCGAIQDRSHHALAIGLQAGSNGGCCLDIQLPLAHSIRIPLTPEDQEAIQERPFFDTHSCLLDKNVSGADK